MRTIWKTELTFTDHQTITLPAGSKAVFFGNQLGQPCLWWEVEDTAAPEPYAVRLAGTGHPLTGNGLPYVGSAMFQGGTLVFHAFA